MAALRSHWIRLGQRQPLAYCHLIDSRSCLPRVPSIASAPSDPRTKHWFVDRCHVLGLWLRYLWKTLGFQFDHRDNGGLWAHRRWFTEFCRHRVLRGTVVLWCWGKSACGLGHFPGIPAGNSPISPHYTVCILGLCSSHRYFDRMAFTRLSHVQRQSHHMHQI